MLKVHKTHITAYGAASPPDMLTVRMTANIRSALYLAVIEKRSAVDKGRAPCDNKRIWRLYVTKANTGRRLST